MATVSDRVGVRVALIGVEYRVLARVRVGITVRWALNYGRNEHSWTAMAQAGRVPGKIGLHAGLGPH